MKIHEHLFKYKRRDGFEYYTIRYNQFTVANRKTYDNIIGIYDECVKCNWDETELKNIKAKYKCFDKTNEFKYIYKNNTGSYIIVKGNKYYCSSKDLNEIIHYRDELIKNNWNMDSLDYKRSNHRNLPKYISITGKRYIICYKNDTYGTYKNLEDAIEERDLLIKHDWDYNFVDLY